MGSPSNVYCLFIPSERDKISGMGYASDVCLVGKRSTFSKYTQSALMHSPWDMRRLEIRNVRNSSLPMFLFLPSNRDREHREIQNANFAPTGSIEAGFFVEVNKIGAK